MTGLVQRDDGGEMDSGALTPLAASALIIGRDAALELWRARDPGLDPVDGLILATVVHANVDAITNSPQEQLAYAGLAEPPPQAVRRPISISRVADSIDLKFGTVRRRIKRLEAAGLIETTRAGVTVPEAYFLSAANLKAVTQADQTAARAYHRLAAVGFFARHPLPDALPGGGTHPHRAVTRLLITYALRLGSDMRLLVGDFQNLMLIMQLTHLNTLHLGDRRDSRTQATQVAPTADGDRAPVSASALARAVDAPFETTRRRLTRLAEQGLCKAVDGGYIVPTAVIRDFAFKLAASNETNLARLFRGCALVGAVDAWAKEPGDEARARCAG